MPLTIAYGWSLSAQRNARTDMTAEDSVELLGATTRLASAYFSRNAVPTSEIPQIMTDIHTRLAGLGQTVPEPEHLRPAVQPRSEESRGGKGGGSTCSQWFTPSTVK